MRISHEFQKKDNIQVYFTKLSKTPIRVSIINYSLLKFNCQIGSKNVNQLELKYN